MTKLTGALWRIQDFWYIKEYSAVYNGMLIIVSTMLENKKHWSNIIQWIILDSFGVFDIVLYFSVRNFSQQDLMSLGNVPSDTQELSLNKKCIMCYSLSRENQDLQQKLKNEEKKLEDLQEANER